MDPTDIEKALDALRGGLKQDGADLVVQAANEDCIELKLVLGESSCNECIVSNEILVAKVRVVLSKILPNVPRILLHDPRVEEKLV